MHPIVALLTAGGAVKKMAEKDDDDDDDDDKDKDKEESD